MINFKVGQNEEHKVSFNYDTLWGKITIDVDGERKVESRKMVIGKTPFQFQIGNKEKHNVRIELNNPLGFAIRGSDMKAYVDEKLVHEEHIGAHLIMIIAVVTFAILVFWIFLSNLSA